MCGLESERKRKKIKEERMREKSGTFFDYVTVRDFVSQVINTL